MYPPERQRAITELLLSTAEGRASVTEIVDRVGVTSETVRRDLDVLERRGVIRRIRGGAELVPAAPFEVALAARHSEQHQDKATIARHVVGSFPDQGTVMLDAGSMTWYCAQAIPQDARLVVITNNLPAARSLIHHEQVSIIMLPGMLRGVTSATIDSTTVDRIGELTVDIAVIGAAGVSIARGLTTRSADDAATKRSMLLAARRRVAPLVSGKFGRDSLCSFAAVSELDLIVTDEAASTDTLTQLATAGPEIEIASAA